MKKRLIIIIATLFIASIAVLYYVYIWAPKPANERVWNIQLTPLNKSAKFEGSDIIYGPEQLGMISCTRDTDCPPALKIHPSVCKEGRCALKQ